MSTSISTSGQFAQLQSETLRTQSRLSTLQQQAATGSKGVVFGDLGVDARQSQTLRASTKQLDQFKTNIAVVEARAGIMDTAMSRMNTLLAEVRTEYAKLGGNLSTDTTSLNNAGLRAMREMEKLLNTQLDGRYLFAGNSIRTKPVLPVDTGTNNLLDRYSVIVADVNAGNRSSTAGLGGRQSAIQAMSDALRDPARVYNPPPEAPPPAVAGTPLFPAPVAPETVSPVFAGAVFYGGTPVRARVDVDFDAEYGVRADAPVFQDMLQTFAMAAAIRFPTTPTALSAGGPETQQETYNALISQGQSLSISAVSDLGTEQGKLGLVRRQIKQIGDKHSDVITILRKDVGRIEDADLAEVFTKIQQTQVSLQATFKITAGLQDLSLLNYLR